MKDFIVVYFYFRFYSLYDFTSQYNEFIFTIISPGTLIVDSRLEPPFGQTAGRLVNSKWKGIITSSIVIG